MRYLLYTCLTVSSVSGIIYELVWSRKAALIFGSTADAVALTLAAFLLGTALGAEAAGRRVSGLRRPVLTFGCLQAGMALYAFASLWLLDGAGMLYGLLERLAGPSGILLGLVEAALLSVVLLPVTAGLGASFVLALRGSAEPRTSLGCRVGMLSACSAAGSVFGVWLAAFVLLPQAGLMGTMLGGAGIAVAGAAIAVLSAISSPGLETPSAESTTGRLARPPLLIVSILAAGSGFLLLLLEVAWTRGLGLVLGSAVRGFALVLITIFLGLSLGSMAAAWLMRRMKSSYLLPAVLVILAGSVCASLAFFPHLSDWFFRIYVQSQNQPGMFVLLKSLLAAAVILAPATMAGALFPLIVETSGSPPENHCQDSGRLYAWNVAGAIAGALAGGLLAVPQLGIRGALVLGIYTAAAMAVPVCLMLTGWPRVWQLTGAGVVLVAALALHIAAPAWDARAMTAGAYYYAPRAGTRGPAEHQKDLAAGKMIFYRDGAAGTVTVVDRASIRTLQIDGRSAGSNGLIAPLLLAHFPFLTGRTIRRACVAGLGTGITAGAIAGYAVESVEVAETEPAVREAAALFNEYNHGALANPKVKILRADARNLIASAAPDSYDLIVSHPSHPWSPDSAKLFTAEFFRLARTRMRRNGIFAQWMQAYGMDYSVAVAFLKTFTDVFPHTLVADLRTNGGEVLLFGSAEPLTVDWAALDALFANPDRAAELARVRIRNPGSLLARIKLSPSEITRLTAGAGVNTDDNGMLEFSSASNMYVDSAGLVAAQLFLLPSDPWASVRNPPDARRQQETMIEMARSAIEETDYTSAIRFAAQAVKLAATPEAYLVTGDIQFMRDDKDAGLASWRRALEKDPDFLPGLTRLVTYYGTLWDRLRPAEYPAWRQKVERSKQR